MNTRTDSQWNFTQARIDEALPVGSGVEYRLRAVEATPPNDEVEGDEDAVELRVYWGATLLRVVHLDRDRSFVVGDPDLAKGADFNLPEELVGAAPVTVIDKGAVHAIRGATLSVSCDDDDAYADFSDRTVVPLSRGMRVRQTVAAFTFDVALVRRAKRLRRAFTLGALLGGGSLYLLGSALAHAGLLGAVATLTPALGDTHADTMTEDQRHLIQAYLQEAAQKEVEAQEARELGHTPDDAPGGTGTRALATEGSMGDPTSAKHGGRFAHKGDHGEPQLSRVAALREAADFGMIGLMNSAGGGDPEAPIVPWGGLMSDGNDPLSARGNMWGDGIGNSFGIGGLALTGIGEGGGGRGEGIGLGPIGTYGHGGGMGDAHGFGDGHGFRLKPKHETKAPILTPSMPAISGGRIPPEVIQRIIRGNFGRFRACYESGLRHNPNLRGAVSVNFIIAKDGGVAHAGGSGDLPDSGVVSCVTRAFGGLAFPSSESGVVRVSYSIQFMPGA